MVECHAAVQGVTEEIRRRSRSSRAAYLARIDRAGGDGPLRKHVSCTNLAHGFAASGEDKDPLRGLRWPNLAIVSAYNDMLSAHQPLGGYPEQLKAAAREAGATAQFAGGVPAMCDGVTQGQPGMELSLFSRDVIAMATAVALSHNLFDGGLCLGVCDKIVPGMLMGALAFGHLPFVFVPAGPMPSGLPNKEKARVRQLYAQGKVGRDALLEAEAKAYHGPGTCTFYGTANSNQMLMEVMGLHLPGAAFVNPGTALREALTREAARRVAGLTALGEHYTPIGRIVDERAMVNAMVGLLASGGSTNHTLHLIAIARAAGLQIIWDDFSALSKAVPLLARVYPSGEADVNQFHEAGGMGLLIRELLEAGLLHGDVLTVAGDGLWRYTQEPFMEQDRLAWRDAPPTSRDPTVLASRAQPFGPQGGLQVLDGNLGRAVIKVSSVAPEHRVVEAPAMVFDSQEQVLEAFQAGDLNRDLIAVVRFQGPRANGMPELHKLTPQLGVLQDHGYTVGLVTDGRMSGASGKVPAAIHVSPEAGAGGPLARVRQGDPIRIDSETGRLEVLVAEQEWRRRTPATLSSDANEAGCGRELFETFRRTVSGAETGAVACFTGLAGAPAATEPQAVGVQPA